jgi:hypothetical protein
MLRARDSPCQLRLYSILQRWISPSQVIPFKLFWDSGEASLATVVSGCVVAWRKADYETPEINHEERRTVRATWAIGP